MNKIVVYNSKTGFTEKYAKWIADELGCKAVTLNEYMKQPQDVGMVIYGGGVTAGKINGLDKVKKSIGSSRLVVFATAATPQKMKTVIAGIRKNNFTPEEMEQIPFYYMEGGINYEKMNFASRKMLQMMYKMLDKKKERTKEEDEMRKALQASCDNSEKAYIIPLVEYVNS